MNLTSYILVLILVFTLVLTHEANGLKNCSLKVKAHGCFEDKQSRVLKHLILNRRGAVNWTHYDNFLERFVCDCAKVAEKKGFKVFGIQFYAECWGNRTFTKESLPQEKPMDCLRGDLSTTCPSTGPDRVCTGKVWRNFVFSLEKPNACTSKPCKNGGSCEVSGQDSFTCKCSKGFHGKNCDKVDACDSQPCHHGASCKITGNNTYECQCSARYFGSNCENVDACSRLPCKNGATCSRTGNNTYSCKCSMGYFGQNCSEVNRCIISPPCQNGGTCTSTGNSSYTCRCSEGFYGFNCEKVDACSRLPCKNGATCSRTGNNTYSCKCIMGYSGQNCSEVNRCIISPPCQNGGTCTSTGNSSYTCGCPEGFYGFNCEKDCSYPMDIALAIDSSGSVGRRSFQLVKAFLKVFTHHFEVTNTTHFACLHYDHRVYKNFKFKDTQYHNHPSLDAKIQSMRYLGGATLTDQALTVAKTFFFRRNGARNKRKVKRAVVLMTDGKTYYGVPSLVHPTYELKEIMSAKIVAIGVGPYVSLKELQVMADGHYVLVEDFNKLAKAITDVMDLVCQ
ncbi:neurogenic locus notch homolog protein 2-like isoform X1 [Acropora millepora]|uniref:neurogenic locus notch homolog protein 2-like isoform X1 n=1 Tax=Acropora millepora TaxID=45264 RepID=UPI001CF4EC46|nr:neurogenic locus notch homolog protein 2-like isoform X1 [Acropora millepora]